jgi:geranylgeranyl diphosphate/geranylgeranyl-bacteriochlorophyllide a reductase
MSPQMSPANGPSAQSFDVVVVGGGPAGAIAAEDLAKLGRNVMLLDRAGRIKPCGGAIPPRLMRDFDVPDHMLVAHAKSARMIAPSNKVVDMPVEGGFVGLVDREHFDEWLRERAQKAGATRQTGTFERIERDHKDRAIVCFADSEGQEHKVLAKVVIGADGARSKVARQTLKGADKVPCVFAYHEIIKVPDEGIPGYDPTRCDVVYQGHLSPDFYAWIFPHGKTASVGVGSAQKGFSLRTAIKTLRKTSGLDVCETIRTEGAPIPLKPLRKWDNGHDVIVVGDAAGVVAPASGEGIYYAMACGREAAISVEEMLVTGKASALAGARKRYMKAHGKVFWVLGIMQHFWYRNDKRRERFVTMCADPDVQYLTWQAYMNKELVRAKPAAHARIFFKDMGHLLGLSAS